MRHCRSSRYVPQTWAGEPVPPQRDGPPVEQMALQRNPVARKPHRPSPAPPAGCQRQKGIALQHDARRAQPVARGEQAGYMFGRQQKSGDIAFVLARDAYRTCCRDDRDRRPQQRLACAPKVQHQRPRSGLPHRVARSRCRDARGSLKGCGAGRKDARRTGRGGCGHGLLWTRRPPFPRCPAHPRLVINGTIHHAWRL